MKIAEAAGCPIYLGPIGEMLLPKGRAFVVTDENVVHCVDLGWAKDVHTLPAGETTKSASHLVSLLSWLATIGADRSSVVVAVGGGVVGDIAGFAAAVYMRGVRWVNIPSSLLAQVDAGIGGKTAIDLPEGKNLAGAFHSPEFVWIDTDALKSLPDEHFRNGMAEVIKTALILDASFADWVMATRAAIAERDNEPLRQMVTRCAELKAQVVTEDPLEKMGRRSVLNFGHSVGHAIESALGYQGLLHGEAVMIGMMAEALVGIELGHSSPEVSTRLAQLADAWQLPTMLPEGLSKDTVLEAIRKDKKNEGGKLAFALPGSVGNCRLVKDIDQDVVAKVLAQL